MQNPTALESDPSQRPLADLSRMRQDLERQKAEWEEECHRVKAELEMRRQGLDRQAAELEAHGLRLDERQEAVAHGEATRGGDDLMPTDAQRATADPVAPSTMSADSTQSELAAAEAGNDEVVFARLRSYALLRPESETPRPDSIAEAEEVQPPPHVVLDRSPGDEPSVTGGDPEESIDDYMARLLNRIRGAPGPAEAQPQAKDEQRPAIAPQLPVRAAAVVRKASASGGENATHAIPVAPSEPVQLVARTAPPELAVNMKAMRELANMTARGAIDRHAQGRWSKAAAGKTVLGVVSLLCGAWLILRATPLGMLAHTAGFVAIIGGAIWIFQGASLFRNIRQIGRRTTKFVEAESHPMSHDAPDPSDAAQEDALTAIASDA